jgi:hypothetical protein
MVEGVVYIIGGMKVRRIEMNARLYCNTFLFSEPIDLILK